MQGGECTNTAINSPLLFVAHAIQVTNVENVNAYLYQALIRLQRDIKEKVTVRPLALVQLQAERELDPSWMT